MKIGIMCHSSCGGSVRISVDLANALAERGNKVHLFSPHPPELSFENKSGIILHYLVPGRLNKAKRSLLVTEWPQNKMRAFVGMILSSIENDSLDILHYHYALPFAFVAQIIKKKLGSLAPQIIGTLHGTDVSLYGKDPVKSKQLIECFESTDAFTTVSQSHADLAAKYFNFSSSPTVIPNFVDMEKFKDKNLSNTKNSDLKANPPIIIHISNFRPIKDTLTVGKIFSLIKKEIDAKLWLVGVGPDLAGLKRFFKEKGIEKSVYYWGFKQDYTHILRRADLSLITSLSESFSLFTLESLASKVPVLATNVGGLSDLVIPEKTGFLFPLGDIHLASRLALNFFSDSDKQKLLKTNAREHSYNFTLESSVCAYEELYKSRMRYYQLNKPPDRRVVFSKDLNFN